MQEQEKKYKINEIFYSLQGEGRHTGIAAVFVRLSGCNLHCDFCDTQHEDGKMMTATEIVGTVRQYPTTHVILTGGEPSLFVDEPLTTSLHNAGFYLHMETNGTHQIAPGIDWVTFSPKTNPILKHADELKVVYTGQDLSEWQDFDAAYKYLQPCTMPTEDETRASIAKTVEYIKLHPEWQLSVQLHKLIQIP